MLSLTRVQQQLTTRWSTLRYRMEYNGYLSNHLLHGVVALFDLGASEEKVEAFANSYATKLEKTESTNVPGIEHDACDTIAENDAKLTWVRARELLGKRQNFDALLSLYAAEVQESGVDGAVKKHLPHLVGGLAGALLHSIIQLGYAYHIGGDRLVAEGLTYMHFAYLSFDEPPQVNGEERLDKKTLSRGEALHLVRFLSGNEVLLGEMRRKLQAKPLADLETSGLQKRLSTMSGDPDRGSATAFLMIWEVINGYDLSKMDGKLALDLAFWLYSMIEHNDFVILHAVTSAWALQQVEHLLDPKDRQRSWKVWLHVALSAFVTNNCKDVLQSDVCEQQLPEPEPWRQLVAKTLTLADGGLLERDLVHVYKLVQVARDHAERMENVFLTVEERDLITRKSAMKVISCEFGLL